jgi:hypothetical protein
MLQQAQFLLERIRAAVVRDQFTAHAAMDSKFH